MRPGATGIGRPERSTDQAQAIRTSPAARASRLQLQGRLLAKGRGERASSARSGAIARRPGSTGTGAASTSPCSRTTIVPGIFAGAAVQAFCQGVVGTVLPAFGTDFRYIQHIRAYFVTSRAHS